MNLDNNITDRLASLSRGVLGAIPIAGPLVAEVVNSLIPNQRIDRISKFVKCLDERLASFEKQLLTNVFKDPCFIDLLEDGFWGAARAISDERIQYIASVVANGISEETEKTLEAKKFAQILAELNDIEVIILRSYLTHYQEDQDFYEKHKDILGPHAAHLGSSEEEVGKAEIYKSYKQNLLKLNLIKPNFKRPKRGELPEFDDETGMIKASGYKITYLGRMLLVHIGLAETPLKAKKPM